MKLHGHLLLPARAHDAEKEWVAGHSHHVVLPTTDDVRAVATYLSKTFTMPVRHGHHRYMAARGFVPERIRFVTENEDDAYGLAIALMGGVVPESTLRSVDIEGRSGPPVVSLLWDDAVQDWRDRLGALIGEHGSPS